MSHVNTCLLVVERSLGLLSFFVTEEDWLNPADTLKGTMSVKLVEVVVDFRREGSEETRRL